MRTLASSVVISAALAAAPAFADSSATITSFDGLMGEYWTNGLLEGYHFYGNPDPNQALAPGNSVDLHFVRTIPVISASAAYLRPGNRWSRAASYAINAALTTRAASSELGIKDSNLD